MEDSIRMYFDIMLEEDYDLDAAKENLIEMIEEVMEEYK